MKGCLRALLILIVVGCICMVVVAAIAASVPDQPKPFNPGGVGQAPTIVR